MVVGIRVTSGNLAVILAVSFAVTRSWHRSGIAPKFTELPCVPAVLRRFNDERRWTRGRAGGWLSRMS